VEQFGLKAMRSSVQAGPNYQLPFKATIENNRLSLKPPSSWRKICSVRAHGMWTYEPRQGRKAATVVCSVSAVVTLTLFHLRFAISDLRLPAQLEATHQS
jgi:hypothetical protein